MKEIHDIVRAFEAHRDEPLALATLVRARGSSYRRAGARMLISNAGAIAGSLSGGCLEDEVAAAARHVLRDGKPLLLEFDTRRRFGCAGAIEIFVERAAPEFLAEIAAQFRARNKFRIATVFEDGSRVLSLGEHDENAFVQAINPSIALTIFGDGPDSAPLRNFAQLLGWQIIEIENAAELPVRFDPWSAVVVKSHNYGRDFAALRHSAPLELRYLGLIGPRKRRDQLLGDLLDSGVELNAELFAPCGLDLGAETPDEIALAIVSEIQAVFAEGSAQWLRDRKEPIHRWNEAALAEILAR